MPVDARIDQVCDAVVARLREANPGLSVEAVDAEDIPEEAPAVRTVYVLPAGYGQFETVTRGVDANDYRVAVVVFDRTDPPASKAWRKGLTAFVEQKVYAPLQDAREESHLLGVMVPQAAEVVEVYDPERLMEGQFFSELLFTFREYAAA